MNRVGEGGMLRLRDALILILVACAVPGSTFVLGQIQQGQGQFTVTLLATQAEAKQKEVTKADARSKEGVAKKEAAGKAAAPLKAARRAVVLKQVDVAAAPAAAALDAQAAQYVEQFRPMFKSEYYFIANACDLTKDQRKNLARLGETAVKAAAGISSRPSRT